MYRNRVFSKLGFRGTARNRVLKKLGFRGTARNRVLKKLGFWKLDHNRDYCNPEENFFSRFIALMRRFSRIFHGLRKNDENKTAIWEFDLGRKGAGGRWCCRGNGIAVLESGIDSDGINPANIQLLMSWIWQATAADPNKRSTQFVLTSHSPSVLREFDEKPHYVYVVRLEKRNFSSTVTNLNVAVIKLRRQTLHDAVDQYWKDTKKNRDLLQKVVTGVLRAADSVSTITHIMEKKKPIHNSCKHLTRC